MQCNLVERVVQILGNENPKIQEGLYLKTKQGNMECENEKYGSSTPVSLFCPQREVDGKYNTCCIFKMITLHFVCFVFKSIFKVCRIVCLYI